MNTDNCCSLFFFDRYHAEHGWRHCDTCREAMGYRRCDGCKILTDPEKLSAHETMEEYEFCSECLEENPHPCADPKCDGIAIGISEHCNYCISKHISTPVKVDIFGTLGNILNPKKSA